MTRLQVGGDHYTSRLDYEHWDWSLDIGMLGLPYAATKYACRWRRKDGVQGLLKARSYVQKMQQFCRERTAGQTTLGCLLHDERVGELTRKLSESLELTTGEEIFCLMMAQSETEDDYAGAERVLDLIIRRASTEDGEQAAMRGVLEQDVEEGGVSFRPKLTEHPAPFGFDFDQDG